MTCFNPRRVWITGFNEDGKKVVKLTNVEETSMKNYIGTRFLDVNKDSYVIPCGQCIGCRIDYSKYWANRAYLESLEWNCNYFITLTYDDEHMPASRSVSKREWQLFIKRFRKFFNEAYEQYCLDNNLHYDYVKIRYLAAAEYGESISFRPHYHSILFNCPFFDLDYIFEVKDRETGRMKKVPMFSSGVRLAHSKILDKAWPYGLATIAGFTWNTAAYVARYVVKKQTGENASVYKNLGVNPPFMLSSRRPGLGYNYYVNHLDLINEVDEIYVPQGMSGKISIQKPGKYCDSINAKINPQTIKAIKEVRKYLVEHNTLYDSTYDDFRQQLKSKEKELEKRVKIHKSTI